jgi:hypothetical protein
MCYECWEEEGKPQIDTPAVREAAAAVGAVYELNGVGGNLHIVLDDWNLEDGSVEFCDRQIANQPGMERRPAVVSADGVHAAQVARSSRATRCRTSVLRSVQVADCRGTRICPRAK